MPDQHPPVYSVKRHGTTLEKCEDEPIRTPGCIQPHGVLFVLRLRDLTILQVSENSERLVGLGSDMLLGRHIRLVLGDEECVARLQAALDTETLECNPQYLFTIRPRVAGSTTENLDVTAHTIDGSMILELEVTQRTLLNPPDYYALLKKTSVRLQVATTVEAFCTIAVTEMRQVTGLDRVMIYRFHPDASGEVVAEERRDDLPSWKGLRYPAEDIPKNARDIFKKLRIRPLPDIDAEMAELVPLANPDTQRPTDLTHSALRGASVMYTEYLRNMGVAASLTMPILREGELWGLVACHHLTPIDLHYQLRAAAEFLAHVISLELRAAEQRENYNYMLRMDSIHDAMVSRAATEGGLAIMVEPEPVLLDGIESTGAAIYHREQWWTIGKTPAPLQLEKLGIWLRNQMQLQIDVRPYFVTDKLCSLYPDAAAFDQVASGILAVAISHNCHNLMIWFRSELLQTVRWAGNPYEKPVTPGPHGARLTPRASFALWQETARQRSAPWLDVEINAALKLRMQVMELIVTRAERIATLNAELVRSNNELDAFAYVASHDLKEPLRGIHKYASYLKEQAEAGNPPDANARQRIDAVLRLTVRMDGLLDSLLRYSRIGRLALEYEAVDVNEVVKESIDMLGSRIEDSFISIHFPRDMATVRCDRIRVREIFTNLISNSLKYNVSSPKLVEIGYYEPHEYPEAWKSIANDLAGKRVFYVRDNGIGIHERHHQTIFDMFKRLHGRDAYGGGSGAGLAITRKLVEQHGGMIWVESRLLTGSCFFLTLTSANFEVV